MGFNQAPALPYRNLGIVEDGDTASQAIEKDKYIIWKGQNYFAKTDILQGETFVVDTNLTAMPEGVINGIVDTLNASLMVQQITTIQRYTSNTNGITIRQAFIIGKLAVLNFLIEPKSLSWGSYILATGLPAPSEEIWCNAISIGGTQDNDAKTRVLSINTSGEIHTLYRPITAEQFNIAISYIIA